MKRTPFAAAVAFASLAALAQPAPQATTAAGTQAAQPKSVAVINGDVITADTIDFLYGRINQQVRGQYEKAGGKGAFLDNYLRKRLIVQEAVKHGFDKRPDVQAEIAAAKESAIFDAYVREEISKAVVSDADVKKYYDEHPTEFATPESVNVRHIILMVNGAGPKLKTKQQAIEQLQKIAANLQEATKAYTTPEAKTEAMRQAFAEAAKKNSEDGVASSGGSLGWVNRGALDAKFEEVAFSLQPGMLSSVVDTPFGEHLIFVDGKRPAGMRSLDDATRDIRTFLQSQHVGEVMAAVTKLSNELRADSKVSLFPENLH
jgi:EpsD family peptidyl-prolyl cis-trans isomerase